MSTPAEIKLDTLSETLKTHTADIKKLKETTKAKSLTATIVTASAAAATASATGLAASISLFKVDEKGITILGATREFKWINNQISRLQKRIENSEQRDKRARDEIVKSHIRDIEKIPRIEADVNALRRRLSRAAQAASQASINSRRTLAADPDNRTNQGVHSSRPVVRGVASDVKSLEQAISALASVLA
ncbi:hypothetical protein [Streptomyces endophyticus]|uniref:Uncharacterized protein n=1 Tax=Streptomyces endophyticus TaxID=714166 RepID=A0ABU6FJ51_9ACTN|nr:hypothetical protein [Streptomyces endophyticus]MEB8344079.1 hypothetical protein [Streptomyces endophyticus]